MEEDFAKVTTSTGTGLERLEKELRKNPAYRKVELKIDFPFAIAMAVQDFRVSKGWTQKQLAKRIGTKQPAIARIENGSYMPSTRILQKIANAGKVRLEIRFVPV